MDKSINNNKSFNLLDANEHGIAMVMNITSIFIQMITIHVSITLSLASEVITRIKHENNHSTNNGEESYMHKNIA